MGYDLPTTICSFCSKEYSYGLYGNPQTWSGIEEQKACERCSALVCCECARTWESPSETIRKLCPNCINELSDDEAEIFTGNVKIKIRKTETLTCGHCGEKFESEYYGNPNQPKYDDYLEGKCLICGVSLCERESCCPTRATIVDWGSDDLAQEASGPVRIKLCLDCEENLPLESQKKIMAGSFGALKKERIKYCEKAIKRMNELEKAKEGPFNFIKLFFVITLMLFLHWAW